MTWGRSFQKLREDLGVSRFEVGAQIGMSDRFVQMLESGRINPNNGFVAKATRAVIDAHRKKNAPEAGQGSEGSDQNPYQEERS